MYILKYVPNALEIFTYWYNMTCTLHFDYPMLKGYINKIKKFLNLKVTFYKYFKIYDNKFVKLCM